MTDIVCPIHERNVDAMTVDAFEFLQREHVRLAQAFAEWFASHSEVQRSSLLAGIISRLRIHMALETEVFQPRYLNATADALSDYVAFVNRETVRKLIEEIEAADPAEAAHSTRVQDLYEAVSHHVREAEKPDGLFVQARRAGVDAEELGPVLLARRDDLLTKVTTSPGRRQRR